MSKEFVRPGTYEKHYQTWADLYAKGTSCQGIADLYGTKASTVNRALKRMGVEPRNPWDGGTKYAELWDEWLNLYEQGMSLEKIAEQYNCSMGIVWHTLNKNGIKRRSISEAVRKYEIGKEDFFRDIDNEEKAYWLGFMMADGCVRIGNKKDKTVNLALQSRDIDHLVKYKAALGLNSPIQSYHYEYRHDLSRVQTNSSMLFDDLVSHGCIPRKSLIVMFPQSLPEPLFNHFIRGYFDGDGCVTTFCTFSIVGGEPMLIRFREIFHMMLGLNMVKFAFDKKASHILRLQYRGRTQFSKIYRWLYDGSTVWLDRKRKRFEELISK